MAYGDGSWKPAFNEPEPKVHQTEIEAAVASIRGEEARPPDSAGDLAMVRPMFQGMLAGTVLKWISDESVPLRIRDVEITKDSNGDYPNHFVVITESGLRLRVTVEGES